METLREAYYEEPTLQFSIIKYKLNHLLANEEAYWKQRPKVFWLKDGDFNSRFFFHIQAFARKKINSIVSLKHDDDTVAFSHFGLCDVAKKYFHDFYCNANVDIDPIINHILVYLSFDDNLSLIVPFSVDEFCKALFAMDSNKFPSPYGLNLAFYKKFWNLCGMDIFVAASTWLENGFFPSHIKSLSQKKITHRP